MNNRQPPQKETWLSGEAYEHYVGRWSRLVAREFLNWLNVSANAHWLDVGCGTGALSQTILDSAAPSTLKGIDRSDGFVAFAREQILDERARFEVGDTQALPVETARAAREVAEEKTQHSDRQSRPRAELNRRG
jgi:ubiquinone/menaquinone biosynthesis C-methylase UbiE